MAREMRILSEAALCHLRGGRVLQVDLILVHDAILTVPFAVHVRRRLGIGATPVSFGGESVGAERPAARCIVLVPAATPVAPGPDEWVAWDESA